MPEPAVRVHGLRELSAAFAKADRDVRLGFRAELRNIGRPIQQDAQRLALSEIPGMAGSPKWAGMRIGVTRKLVYVAPRRRGVRTHLDPRSRGRQFADLLMGRAMEPALERNKERAIHEFEQLLDEMANRFNRAP